MSRRAVEWASRQTPPRPDDKLVLWALADAAGDKALTAWPSIPAVAAFTGLERKRIMASLARLQALGMIEDTGERCGRTGQVKVFRVVVGGGQTVPLPDRCRDHSGSGKSPVPYTLSAAETVPPRDPEPYY